MRAAILVKQNQPLVVADLALPKLEVGQVLVQVKHTSICGKQVDELTGRRGDDPFLPHLLGHEGGGIVLEAGPGVRKVKPGDHVVLHWTKGPGIDSAPPRYTWNGQSVSAGWVTTFSDQTIVSENRVTPIDKDLPLDVAALMGCAVTTGLGIVFNNAELKPGQSIAVLGAGGVGLNVLQGAALVSAGPIAAMDVDAAKLEESRRFGATHTIVSGPDAKAGLLAVSGPGGFDAVVDTTGITKVRELAFQVTANTGRTIFAGVPYVNESIGIDSFALHAGRRMIGSHGGETKPGDDIPRYFRLYRAGRLKLDEQIACRYPLDAINEAFDRVRAGVLGRCMIDL